MGNKMGDIQDLEDTIASLREALTKQGNRIASFESTLKEFVKDEEIDTDVAQSLADCFGINLTREYSITVIARFSGTVTVDAGYDIDDLQGELAAELSAGWADGFTVDVDCDEVEVEDYTEE
jgi:hypothetical protein